MTNAIQLIMVYFPKTHSLNSKQIRVLTRCFSTAENNSIEIDLQGSNSVHILLCSKNYMFYLHCYSDNGTSIKQLEVQTIYGEKITPESNGIIVKIPLGSWISGTMIVSYTQVLPTIYYK